MNPEVMASNGLSVPVHMDTLISASAPVLITWIRLEIPSELNS